MLPDGQGRFGFNVKGGMDQGVPVIVSRVAGGTPADTCIPRLSEGDQVVMINGRDIGPLTHDQVNFLYLRIMYEITFDYGEKYLELELKTGKCSQIGRD